MSNATARRQNPACSRDSSRWAGSIGKPSAEVVVSAKVILE
jgi:hypothetical protein